MSPKRCAATTGALGRSICPRRDGDSSSAGGGKGEISLQGLLCRRWGPSGLPVAGLQPEAPPIPPF